MSSNKRVRIVNDGQPPRMTKITDAETGKEIPQVTFVNIHINADLPVISAHINTIMPVVDVIADAEIKQVCPCCGRPVETDK